MKLTLQHIRQATGNAAFSRGREYFNRGRVMRLETETDGAFLYLRGETLGSSNNSYVQDIQLERLRYGVEIDGECSCPVGYNCKHVAAVCLHYAREQQAGPDLAGDATSIAMRRWLAELQASVSPVAPDERPEFVAYVLVATGPRDGSDGEAIAIEARVVKHRKNGQGLTRGRSVELYTLRYDHLGIGCATPLDRDIAKLLCAGADSWHGGLLEGEVGYLALRRLLESGCCFWNSTDGPRLAWDLPRPLEMEWVLQAPSAMLELELTVTGNALLLPTTPPTYLDPVAAAIGPVETGGLERRHIELLQRAPAVHVDEAEALSTGLVRSCPGLTLPLPGAIDVRDLPARTPMPRLRLAAVEIGQREHHVVHLDFEYGGVPVPAVPASKVTVLESDDALVRIARDLDSEAEYARQLEALGFAQLASANTAEQSPPPVYVADGSDALADAGVWSRFLGSERATLESGGWRIEIDESFRFSFERAELSAEIDTDSTGADWFALGFAFTLGDEKIPLLDAIAPLLETDWTQLPEIVCIALDGYRHIEIPAARLRPILDTLRALFEGRAQGPGDELRLSRYDASRLLEFEQHGIAVNGGDHLKDIARRLDDFTGVEQIPVPDGLLADLRGYQRQGLNWLQFLREYNFNGILADDMGLGKTVQTLAHLLVEKNAGRLTRPALLVAPTSVIGNWRDEAARFTPALRTVVLHGTDRHRHFTGLSASDLIITTYALLSRDTEELLKHDFHSVILDEAQMVKNPRSKSAAVVRQLECTHRLCLTGTPMENHLGELWALFDFLMPGFLDDAGGFTRKYRTPIEKHGDADLHAHLSRRIKPFMLRRTKTEVATELPPKTEIVRRASFGAAQAELYESIRVAMHAKVRAAIARQGLERSHITILDALLKLRQTCCDPRLLTLENAAAVGASAKFELLFDLLPTLLEEGRRVLLFSQFTSMLALIEDELGRRRLRYAKLTGATRNRDEAIAQFRSGDVELFLISLKAGGVGLNLPEADTVIHYDPWWNPAVEAQATDRAHRIGQEQPVFVYKLIVEDSVEEKLLELQDRKRALADGIYARSAGAERLAFDAADLAALLDSS